MSYETSLNALRSSLTQLQNKQVSIASFCQQWRNQSALLSALSPRYAQVMEDLLGRLEAGSLFTEESCSFSQEDLHGSLAIWLDKAQQTLEANQQS